VAIQENISFKDEPQILISTEEEYIESPKTLYKASTLLQACRSVEDRGLPSSSLRHEG
jgi:hypothetical protein